MDYYCNYPLYRYDREAQTETWLSCGTCAFCEAYSTHELEREVSSINWMHIIESCKLYFFAVEEPHVDEAIRCQDPIEIIYYDMGGGSDTYECRPCEECPRCVRRAKEEQQELLEYAEAAAY